MFQESKKNTPSSPLFSREAYHSGRCDRAWTYFGAHPHRDGDGTEGWLFRLWAPHADAVSIVGDFNVWVPSATPMTALPGGVWEGFVPGLKPFDRYRFAIRAKNGSVQEKADPYAFHADLRPNTASRLYDLTGDHPWEDGDWLAYRARSTPGKGPMNVYECHLGSWRRTGDGHFLNYRAIADWLVPYVKEMGYTHVEFLPVTEHPLDDSWGYQCTGYFAPTSRFGTPGDFKFLIDQLHRAGVGVILDWVPAHFPRDWFGLTQFDGMALYEYDDPKQAVHPHWGTNCFDLGRAEVRSFLLSSARFWLEEFHADGLRVDAVSSMLYLDFGRESGDWTPNAQGNNLNLAAIEFLQTLTTTLRGAFPGVVLVAEESSAWPGITAPADQGGLGFHLKWNMGWMNDTCRYMTTPPDQRPERHRDLTFPLMYAFHEQYILPISHDEVTHGKLSYLNKTPGEDHVKFAAARAFYTHMMTQPGKKLSFMGAEFGQWQEWTFRHSLDWHLLDYDRHRLHRHFFQSMNAYYLSRPCLWEEDDSWAGFQWLSADDKARSTIAYLRKDSEGRALLVACNFSGEHHPEYRVGVPYGSTWTVDFSTDAWEFGGSGRGSAATVKTEAITANGYGQSVLLDLPPMTAVILRCVRKHPVRTPRALRRPRKAAPAKKAEG